MEQKIEEQKEDEWGNTEKRHLSTKTGRPMARRDREWAGKCVPEY